MSDPILILNLRSCETSSVLPIGKDFNAQKPTQCQRVKFCFSFTR